MSQLSDRTAKALTSTDASYQQLRILTIRNDAGKKIDTGTI